MNFAASPMATVIFLATIGLSLYALFKNQNLLYQFMLHPYSLVREKKYYQLITSGFIHADLGHLMMNMITFYFFAFKLEMYVGTFDFFIIYFGCLIISDLTTIAKHKDDYGYRALGASGAVSGVLLSTIIFDPNAGIYIFIFREEPIPGYIFALLYFVFSYFAGKRMGDHINHEAHLWGGIGGVVLISLLNPDVLVKFFYKIFS